MADPPAPPQIDGKVLRSMRHLIIDGTRVHRLSLEEARGRAWGYGRAYHAWLPAAIIDAAVDHCCARIWPLPSFDAGAETPNRATGAMGLRG
ncbi:MAG TPA: hypothetical protein VGM87_20965 [Roseomonas sp.]|jgi:hypothetical protein